MTEEDKKPAEETNTDEPEKPLDLEAIVARNGDSPTLSLSCRGLTADHLKIMSNILKNNNVRISHFCLKRMIK